MNNTLISLDLAALATVQGGTDVVWSPQFKFDGTGPTRPEAREDFLRRCQGLGNSPGACQAARLDTPGAVQYNPDAYRSKVQTPNRKRPPGYGAD